MNIFLLEKVYKFISSIIFLIALSISIYFISRTELILVDISVLELIVLVLAIYRLSRMMVYDKVFSLIRYLIKANRKSTFFNSISNLITCPWCTSIWIALFIFDIYFLVPYGDYLVYILAISAVASPLILISNNITFRNDILSKEKRK